MQQGPAPKEQHESRCLRCPGELRDQGHPDTGAEAGEVRVRVRQTGICGTDLHIHNGKFFAEFPLTPGHELIGPVDALGEGTEGFRVGEYVAVNPNMNCGHCAYCRVGRTLLCANLKGLGTNWPGSFAEYVVVPANLVFSVDGIDPDVSVFTEPTACAMHGVETLSPRPGSTALVFGAGPTGLLLSQLIARGGAVSVTVAASSAFKLKRAEELGIDTRSLWIVRTSPVTWPSSKRRPAVASTSWWTPPVPRRCRSSACRSPAAAGP